MSLLDNEIAGTSLEGPKKDVDSLSLEIAKLSRYNNDTADRRWLAKWAVGIVSVWLGTVLLILFFNHEIRLSDAVLITLLGTTTLNVLGLTFIVLRGHFGNGNSQ